MDYTEGSYDNYVWEMVIHFIHCTLKSMKTPRGD